MWHNLTWYYEFVISYEVVHEKGSSKKVKE